MPRTRRTDAAAPTCRSTVDTPFMRATRRRSCRPFLRRAARHRLLYASAGDIQEDFFHALTAIARDQLPRRTLVDDDTGAQHDDVVAHPLDLAHVMRREQHRAAGAALIAF